MPVVSDRFKEFNAAVLAACANAGEITGIEVVEFGKTLIGTPVERMGGGVVIRSQPEEPPRADTKELQANLQHDVDRTGDDIVKLTFTTGRPSEPEVPAILEFGIGIQRRPYFVADGGQGSMWTETERVATGIAVSELQKVK
jgi:hypothetical protein